MRIDLLDMILRIPKHFQINKKNEKSTAGIGKCFWY